MISIHEAIDTVIAAVRPLPAEEVPLLKALGRATATAIVSPEAVPSFDNSAMDGYAVRGADHGVEGFVDADHVGLQCRRRLICLRILVNSAAARTDSLRRERRKGRPSEPTGSREPCGP